VTQSGQEVRVGVLWSPATRSNSGQDGASGGEKWNVPGASVEYAELARVVAAWPVLPRGLKIAILAIVDSEQPPERSEHSLPD